MIILDIPRRIVDHGRYDVDIPVYHRTHLGLSQDTIVHYCILPARPTPHTGDPGGSAPELVVAPFAFETWDQLWRLTISTTDKAGLLFEISDTMREFGANILASEAAIMEERGMFHVEMVLHISDAAKVAAIEWTLLARLFQHIDFLPGGKPRVRLRRVGNLWRIKQSFDRLSSISSRDRSRSLAFRPYHDKAKVEPVPGTPNRPRSLRLRLPDKVRGILQQTVATPPDWGYQLRISDTKDRFLRVLYFRSSDPVLHARVEHDDQIGSFASIAHALREANFTILTALSTPAEARGRGFTEFVVRAMNVDKKNTADVKHLFERALASSPAAKDLSIKIGYPSGYAAAWDRTPLRYTPVNVEPTATVYEQFEHDALVEMVSLQHRNLGRLLNKGTLSGTDQHRWVLASRLLAQHSNVALRRAQSSIFISCHYEGKQLDVARRMATEMGFVVVTGQNLEKFPNMAGGLIEKIQTCSNFLGIWSEVGAKRVGAECSPSPRAAVGAGGCVRV